MERKVGTVSRGIRAPIIREGDDLGSIVIQSLLDASKSFPFTIRMLFVSQNQSLHVHKVIMYH